MSDTFAAVHVGSYELTMKIFEISRKNGLKCLDHIRHRIDLGSETYATGTISSRHMLELTRVLKEFSEIMKSYGVTNVQAYGTSALRETHNINIICAQLEQRTGIKVDILSNSEQRFLDYKSIALQSAKFTELIEEPTAIIDIGGGSIQVSLFDKDKLVTTQNMKLGVLRLRQTLEHLAEGKDRYPELIAELVDSQLHVLSKFYLNDRTYKNLVIIDDYMSPVFQKISSPGYDKGFITSSDFDKMLERFSRMSNDYIAKELSISTEYVTLAYISGILVKRITVALMSQLLWAPGVTLCDGIAYEYAEKKKYITPIHDFEADIIACGMSIAKRYGGSKSRARTLESIALPIFDKTKKLHGLGHRERLLLELSTILHDCGKYISLMNMGFCCYNIIMSTEIIGLSHRERSIVANVVRFNHENFLYFDDSPDCYKGLTRKDYLTIAKLTAILRVANALDRTHNHKFKDVSVTVKDDEVQILLDTTSDITIEKGLINNRASFFEEIFGVKPVIRQKRLF
ncbi:exopolyphosphatase [Butyrivibrio fibrisolvens]|uniref:Ppx/GppA phosphatase family protein n=1 Tax=Butyrivibrio fibrisolvens TaxID=831 RepID=UPI000419557B|nr:exopolyphosphatase [Butyrivibrio fibrisolvens]